MFCMTVEHSEMNSFRWPNRVIKQKMSFSRNAWFHRVLSPQMIAATPRHMSSAGEKFAGAQLLDDAHSRPIIVALPRFHSLHAHRGSFSSVPLDSSRFCGAPPPPFILTVHDVLSPSCPPCPLPQLDLRYQLHAGSMPHPTHHPLTHKRFLRRLLPILTHGASCSGSRCCRGPEEVFQSITVRIRVSFRSCPLDVNNSTYHWAKPLIQHLSILILLAHYAQGKTDTETIFIVTVGFTTNSSIIRQLWKIGYIFTAIPVIL